MSAHVWRKRENRREREGGPAFTGSFSPSGKATQPRALSESPAGAERGSDSRLLGEEGTGAEETQEERQKGLEEGVELTFSEISPLTYDKW